MSSPSCVLSRRRVAEAIADSRHPAATMLRMGPVAPVAWVARAIASSLVDPAGGADGPAWLRSDQHSPFQRIMAALDQYRAALLAYPVGSGKTWIALAVAHARSARPVMVLAPPLLQDHWIRTADTLGVSIATWSHAKASRAAPPPGAGMVVIDESHHFRNPQTRRYTTIAPWLVGREVLMLSATPVVNRLGDLVAQLSLGVRDDALALSGVASLATLLAEPAAHPALADVVIAPAKVEAAPRAPVAMRAPGGDSPLVHGIDALALSPHRPIAALIRRVFWRAAASSPAALAETVAAYERLLAHAADAAAVGRRVTRDEIRRFAGMDDAQLVLWEMVAERGDAELLTADLPELRNLRHQAESAAHGDDARVIELRALLSDDVPSLIFTCRRATVRYLRDRLQPLHLAWCTGQRAGVGSLDSSRQGILDAFRAGAATHPLLPRHLVTTDIAAEGLDLSRLSRVIHYDLPWTPARIEQREGRSRRGERAHLVTTHVIPTSAALEARLGVVPLLDRKRQLPVRIGLAGPSPWGRRARLAQALGAGTRARGIAAVAGDSPRLLLGVEVVSLPSGKVVGRSAILCRSVAETFGEPESLDDLTWAATQNDSAPASPEERRAALGWATAATRSILRQHEAATWWRRGSPAARALLARLYDGAREASRRRDRLRLAGLEHAVQVVARGHTAGERMLMQRLAEATAIDPLPLLGHWTAPDPGGMLAVRLSGVVIVRDGLVPFPSHATTGGSRTSDLPQ